MVLVVEPLKVLALVFEMRVALEPLPPEKVFVVRIVKALYDAIAPGFANRDKHWLHAKMEARFDHGSKGSWIRIAPVET